MSLKVNMVGKKIGRLLVISEDSKRIGGMVYWRCRCDCGKETVVCGVSIRKGASQSCGCLRLDRTRKPRGMAAFNKLYNSYKLGAKQRSLIFILNKDEFKTLTTSNCYYCGATPKSECKNNGKRDFFGNFIYNGIDRIKNSLGYTLDNCVPCCSICNQMKHSYTKETFLKQIKEIYMHLNLEGKSER